MESIPDEAPFSRLNSSKLKTILLPKKTKKKDERSRTNIRYIYVLFFSSYECVYGLLYDAFGLHTKVHVLYRLRLFFAGVVVVGCFY